jgi:hypothetical protein
LFCFSLFISFWLQNFIYLDCLFLQSFRPRKFASVVTLREVPGPNLLGDTEYSNCRVPWFS